ncbi:helix-turn-helix domain-containing protein [Blautia sp. An81]|uniref:helix-turn-helix domain-containing protein n=1 Tax=Blautia sp. An81 TaxID=1965659 RepID=UPI000B387958|nr:helix-turn-helix transcriptional regulator [Blautia sp. An81]OUN26646.1 hypothetical protein B5G33_15835 [Blautia sp. An81]
MQMKDVIREKRRACGFTQEQVADFLGVSAPAVNKWESGTTCPDLAILPALARLLGTDPNTLLGFHQNLSREEIAVYANEVAEIARQGDIEKTMELVNKRVKEYPLCGALLYQMATLLRGIRILFSYPEEKAEEAWDLAVSLLERAIQCGDKNAADWSRYALASIYIQDEDYEKAQELIDMLPEYQSMDKRQLQISLCMKEKKNQEAAKLLERKLNGLLQEAFLLLDQLAVVAVREGENKRAWELADYSRKVMEIFKWNYSGLTVSFSVAMEEKDGKRCVEILEEMLEALENPLSMRDSILLAHQEKKEGESDFGNQITKALLDSIEKEDSYAFLRNREDFRKLKEKYTSS